MIHGMKPSRFAGQREPEILEEWIAQMDKLFAATRCPATYRVDIAAFFLTHAAGVWWSLRDLGMDVIMDRYTWDDFKEDIRREFFQTHVQAERRHEFSRLIQGDRTATAYYVRFRELMRFDPHAQADMTYLIQKFEDGF